MSLPTSSISLIFCYENVVVPSSCRIVLFSETFTWCRKLVLKMLEFSMNVAMADVSYDQRQLSKQGSSIIRRLNRVCVFNIQSECFHRLWTSKMRRFPLSLSFSFKKFPDKGKASQLTKHTLNFKIQNGYDHTNRERTFTFLPLKYDELLHQWRAYKSNVPNVVSLRMAFSIRF